MSERAVIAAILLSNRSDHNILPIWQIEMAVKNAERIQEVARIYEEFPFDTEEMIGRWRKRWDDAR